MLFNFAKVYANWVIMAKCTSMSTTCVPQRFMEYRFVEILDIHDA